MLISNLDDGDVMAGARRLRKVRACDVRRGEGKRGGLSEFIWVANVVVVGFGIT